MFHWISNWFKKIRFELEHHAWHEEQFWQCKEGPGIDEDPCGKNCRFIPKNLDGQRR